MKDDLFLVVIPILSHATSIPFSQCTYRIHFKMSKVKSKYQEIVLKFDDCLGRKQTHS
jgi:hypothetical protein